MIKKHRLLKNLRTVTGNYFPIKCRREAFYSSYSLLNVFIIFFLFNYVERPRKRLVPAIVTIRSYTVLYCILYYAITVVTIETITRWKKRINTACDLELVASELLTNQIRGGVTSRVVFTVVIGDTIVPVLVSEYLRQASAELVRRSR